MAVGSPEFNGGDPRSWPTTSGKIRDPHLFNRKINIPSKKTTVPMIPTLWYVLVSFNSGFSQIFKSGMPSNLKWMTPTSDDRNPNNDKIWELLGVSQHHKYPQICCHLLQYTVDSPAFGNKLLISCFQKSFST